MAQTVLKLYFKSSINPLPIGQLSFDEPEREDAPTYFVYDSFWLANGFPLSRDVPLIPKVFKTGLNQPVFGFMYDLIPGLGAKKAARFIHQKDFTNIQLLLQSQETLRIGAVGFTEPSAEPLTSRTIGPVALDLERLILGHSNIHDIDSLYKALDALPGERFKLSYRTNKNLNVISKFNSPDPQRNLTIWEAVALSLAKRMGLKTVSAELTSMRGMETLVSLRFDRDQNGKPIHCASARALLAAHDMSEHTYLEVADILNCDGAKPKEDLFELWQRMVFNMAIGNVNDTLDNISFIRQDDGWRLAPIYSLKPEPILINRRHHATAVSEDCDRPSLDKAVEVAPYFGLSRKKAQVAAAEITAYCADNWVKIAQQFQADPLEMDLMRKAFERITD